MNAMTRLAIATLEHSDPSALEAWARERLTTHAGFTVFAPDDKDAADNWALDRVRAMGRRVVDADATVLPPERAPALWSVWVPSRTTAFPRMVLGVIFSDKGVGRVLYRMPWLPADAVPEVCALSTWHVWVRRTRAVAS